MPVGLLGRNSRFQLDLREVLRGAGHEVRSANLQEDLREAQEIAASCEVSLVIVPTAREFVTILGSEGLEAPQAERILVDFCDVSHGLPESKVLKGVSIVDATYKKPYPSRFQQGTPLSLNGSLDVLERCKSVLYALTPEVYHEPEGPERHRALCGEDFLIRRWLQRRVSIEDVEAGHATRLDTPERLSRWVYAMERRLPFGAPTPVREWVEEQIRAALHRVKQGEEIPFGHSCIQWFFLLARMIDGDELWEFGSPAETWQARMGRQGIALLRNNRVIDSLITVMN